VPLDPQSFDDTLLCSISLLGFGELAIYHAQLLQIKGKPVYLFEQEPLQCCPYAGIELRTELIPEFFDVIVTNKFGHRVHGELWARVGDWRVIFTESPTTIIRTLVRSRKVLMNILTIRPVGPADAPMSYRIPLL